MLAYLVMALVGALLGATYGGHDLRIFHRWRFFLLALVVPVVGSVGFSSAIFSDRLFCYEPDALVRLRGAKIPASAIAEFHKHPAWQRLIRERDENKGAAEQFGQITGFMDKHGLSPAEAAEGFTVKIGRPHV